MSKLPENYRLALNAMKKQAAGASKTFKHLDPSVINKGKSELKDAQSQMSVFDNECRHIAKLLMAKGSKLDPIPEITEDDLNAALMADAI